MRISPNATGAVPGTTTISWTSRDAMIYALGVGSGVGELAFSTENTRGVEQLVLPTYAVVIAQPPFDHSLISAIDRAQALHGAQSITLRGAIPTDGTVEVYTTIAEILDKGPG